MSLQKILGHTTLPFALGIAAVCAFSLVQPAQAANITWDGGGATNNWNEGANWSTNAVPGSADVAIFDGTSTKNLTINTAVNVQGIDINTGYSGTITQGANNITLGSSGFDISSGTFTAGTSSFSTTTFKVSGGTFTGSTGPVTASADLTVSSGTLTAPSSLTLSAGFNITGGSFVHGTGTVTATYLSETWDVTSGAEEFYNLVIDKTDGAYMYMGLNDTFTIHGTLTLTNGKAGSVGNYGYFNVRGNVSEANTFDGGSSIIRFDSASAQTYTIGGGSALGVELDSSADASDSITVNSTATVSSLKTTSGFSGNIPLSNAGNHTLIFLEWSQAAGSYNASAQSLWKLEDFTQTGGTFTAPQTIEATGVDSTWDLLTSLTVSDLTINKTINNTVTIATGDTVIVTDDVTFTAGDANGGTIEVRDDVSVGANYEGGTTTLKFTYPNDQTLSLTGATGNYNGDILVVKNGGKLSLTSALVMDAASQDLTIDEGTFALNGNNLTVNGTSGTIVVQNGGVFELRGTETITKNAGQPTTQAGSTVRYIGDLDGTADSISITSLTSAYGGDLHLLATDELLDTFTLGSNIDINGNLTIEKGALDVTASNRSITIAGNLVRIGTTASNFVERNGTVTMDGASQSITGRWDFYNFTKSVTSAATLTFDSADSPDFTGLITLSGASGQLLSVRSSTSGTAAALTLDGTQSLSYLDVKDSNASSGMTAVCSTGCVDSGNNTNWTF